MSQKLNIPEIVKAYSSRLSGFIRKRVDTIEDAEDILQEVFFQLTKADRLMKPIDQITAWLFTVARNQITDMYRKKKPDLLQEYYSEDDDDDVTEKLGSLLSNNSDTPETQYLSSLVWEELSVALSELPVEQREVFEMTEFKGISFNEIARITGVPLNTLISRKRYAILYLRERLWILYDELINF